MLHADHGVVEEPEQKTWNLMRHSEFQQFQAWKCHKVRCFFVLRIYPACVNQPFEWEIHGSANLATFFFVFCA